MELNFFARFSESLKRLGAAGATSGGFDLGNDGLYRLQYIPFEHVNPEARLVIVGITPGITQLELAYSTTQHLLNSGLSPADVLAEVKKQGAFGGKSMRPNLLKMLRHFGFEKILGVDDVESLWGSNAHLLHSTSVVPHAAFKGTKMFAGSFEEIRQSWVLRNCFEDCLLPILKAINPEALYIGLGPTPEAALRWCARNGYLKHEQILGAFAHPSSAGGSKVAYYLRQKARRDLKPKDPTTYQCDWLDQAYERMRNAVRRLGAEPSGEKAGTEIGHVASEPLNTPTLRASGNRDSRMKNIELTVVYGEFQKARYKFGKQTKYVGEFVSPSGQVVYVKNTTTRLNRIEVVVHPGLRLEQIEKISGVEAVGSDFYFNSNMTRFPKRINKGKTPTGYGWPVAIGSLGDLGRFLKGFGNVGF